MRVLLVDDEKYLTDALQFLLKRSGYDVDIADDGALGLKFARGGVYDAIILDNMLPRMSGIEVLRKLRGEHNTTPILMLSAKSETADKVEGLDVGADDYLAKPFKTSELIARIRAICRRHSHDDKDKFTIGDIGISASSRLVICGENHMELTAKEYDILDLLAANEGKLISTDALFRRAWGNGTFVEPSYVAVYVSYLRKKLKSLGSNTKIKAVRGAGYRLTKGDGNVS